MPRVLWSLLISCSKLYMTRKKLTFMFVWPPWIKILSFHLILILFAPTVLNSYEALVCLVTLSTIKYLVWSFCPSSQMFAANFFQKPSHDRHPCRQLCAWCYSLRSGLSPVRDVLMPSTLNPPRPIINWTGLPCLLPARTAWAQIASKLRNRFISEVRGTRPWLLRKSTDRLGSHKLVA